MLFRKKKAETEEVPKVETEEVPVEIQPAEYVPKDGEVVFHKERWENDSGTNQLVSDSLPSLND